MKTLILYSGHLGSTRSAAEYLATRMSGAEVMSTADKPKVNFADYDVIVFGTNMRMFRPNKLFKKYASKAKKSLANTYRLMIGAEEPKKNQVNNYVFVLGADDNNAEKNAEKARNYVNNCKYAVYVGGILDSTNATGFAKSVIDNIVNQLKIDGKPLPSIDYSKLDELADTIMQDNK